MSKASFPFRGFGVRLGLALLISGLGVSGLAAQTPASPMPLVIEILSPDLLSGTAGDYVTVRAQITNAGPQALSDITTYLSLVDTRNKMPVDLEDWSAERGRFIGTIEPGQTLPLDWKVHFVQPGTYELIVVASPAGSRAPEVSPVTRFQVSPKRNLNPGQVLPVALGTPLVLLLLFLVATYQRQRRASFPGPVS
jgi:hypothetical protein